MKQSLLFFCLLLTGSLSVKSQSYERQLEQWYEAREKSLKAENGWLNLVGLLWLSEGRNDFGSDSANQVVFPKKLPPSAGVLERKGNTVWLNADIPILVNGVEKKKHWYFTQIQHATPSCSMVISVGTSSGEGTNWVCDCVTSKSDALLSFRGIEHYPVNRETYY